MNTDSNDTRLILEGLLVLLELHDSTDPIVDRIHARLATTHSERVPDAIERKLWVPSPDAFTVHAAVLFCNRRTAKGFTAENLRKIGVPWPPPSRWKRRLRDVLVDKFHLKKRGRIYEAPEAVSSSQSSGSQ